MRFSASAHASGVSPSRADDADYKEGTETRPSMAAVALADCDCKRVETAASACDVNCDSRPNKTGDCCCEPVDWAEPQNCRRPAGMNNSDNGGRRSEVDGAARGCGRGGSAMPAGTGGRRTRKAHGDKCVLLTGQLDGRAAAEHALLVAGDREIGCRARRTNHMP